MLQINIIKQLISNYQANAASGKGYLLSCVHVYKSGTRSTASILNILYAML
jgi:hypothetical protein